MELKQVLMIALSNIHSIESNRFALTLHFEARLYANPFLLLHLHDAFRELILLYNLIYGNIAFSYSAPEYVCFCGVARFPSSTIMHTPCEFNDYENRQ